MKRLNTLAPVATLLIFATQAFANSAPTTTTAAAPASAAATTTAAAPSAPTTLLSGKGSLTYVGSFTGSSLTSPFSAYQPDADTGYATTSEDSGVPGVSKEKANGGPINILHSLGLNYKVSSTVSVRPVFVFKQEPMGKELSLDASYVAASLAPINLGGPTLANSIRFYLPTTAGLKKQGLYTTIRAIQSLSYDIPDTKISTNLSTFVQSYIHDMDQYRKGTGGPKYKEPYALRLYAGPNVSYQLTDTLGVGLVYEMQARSRRRSIATFDSDISTNLGPSMSWDVTPAINFAPYLDIKTGNRISLDTTQIAADLTIKLL
jgi:hypothetical protein